MNLYLKEYDITSSELRLYHDFYTRMFTLFCVLVLPAFGVAVQNESLRFIFGIIPLFILTLTYLALFYAYFASMMIGRLRWIQDRIAELNNGVYLIGYARKAEKALENLISKLDLPGGKTKVIVSPLHLLALLIGFSLAVLITYSLVAFVKYAYVAYPMLTIGYVAIISVLSLLAILIAVNVFWYIKSCTLLFTEHYKSSE